MAKGPKGEKRPADVNARAVMIAKIATGEVEDVATDDGKNAAAVALGRMGGKPAHSPGSSPPCSADFCPSFKTPVNGSNHRLERGVSLS
jgi:hypothetical protein